MRNVCVVGWSYEPAFYQALGELADHNVQVTVVANRAPVCVPKGAVVIRRENVGLEWGAYARYLRHWHGGPTLFLHDDTAAAASHLLEVMDKADAKGLDIAFVFQSVESCRRNHQHHGRAWYGSHAFLLKVVNAGGIWYDMDNHGVTHGAYRNRGSNHFFARVTILREEDPTLQYGALIAPDLDLGFRGLLGQAGREAEARYLSGVSDAEGADSLSGSVLQPVA